MMLVNYIHRKYMCHERQRRDDKVENKMDDTGIILGTGAFTNLL